MNERKEKEEKDKEDEKYREPVFVRGPPGPEDLLHGPPKRVEVLEKGLARLPCDLQVPAHGDNVVLVLWYKIGIRTPIYSFDVRGRDFMNAKKWWDEAHFGQGGRERGKFLHGDQQRPFTIQDVTEVDSGLYRCRVDFKFSPTRNGLVNLTVIVPPGTPEIQPIRRHGVQVKVGRILGPVNEGTYVELLCRCRHGDPSPQLRWFRGDVVIDGTWEVFQEDRVQGVEVRNVLSLGPLTPSDVGGNLTCQAWNHELAPPTSTSIIIKLNLKPRRVEIREKPNFLSAAVETKLECETWGSLPSAYINWTLADKNLTATTTEVGNRTLSELRLRVRKEDSGKLLSCTARNPHFPNLVLSDAFILNVHCELKESLDSDAVDPSTSDRSRLDEDAPDVSLRWGASLALGLDGKDGIEEGKDVYLECIVHASPPAHILSWTHNGVSLVQNVSKGVILSNYSLVLQNVRRESGGEYRCSASNILNATTSPPLYLNVKYAPVCRENQDRTVYRLSRREEASVKCQVFGHPPPTSFKWTFNNTSDLVDIPQERYTSGQEESVLRYIPMTELDYGSLQCWSSNKLGTQQIPCIFHVIPVRIPDPPQNCTLMNSSPDSLEVDCDVGFDGGLPQQFLLVVHDEETGELLNNLSSPKEPVFRIQGLEGGRGLRLSIFSFNDKGRSPTVSLSATIPSMAAKRTTGQGLVRGIPLAPVLAILLGVVGGLLLVALVILGLLRRRGSSRGTGSSTPPTPPAPPQNRPPSSSPSKHSLMTDEENPDLILHHVQAGGGGGGGGTSSGKEILVTDPGRLTYPGSLGVSLPIWLHPSRQSLEMSQWSSFEQGSSIPQLRPNHTSLSFSPAR
ncbi:unnamed protein product [Darwinula stevensoni]|uniref:Nephrin n=1 Tax=Darwinula stevensoni TaxID=69355 RepID=A0A7R8X5Y3_9CRUS|nr:unnamed protein product [Darwinula stevensoni]CAG0881461.1 unnamed protein product [Darwinula stevensoni]